MPGRDTEKGIRDSAENAEELEKWRCRARIRCSDFALSIISTHSRMHVRARTYTNLNTCVRA